jgi:glycosyltransferase involved in cell wall biosynthesis
VALERALELGPEERELLFKTAINYIRKNFSKRKMCSRTLAVYDEIMASGRAKRPVLI